MAFQRSDPACHPKIPGIPAPARWAAFALVSAAVHALILYRLPGPSAPDTPPASRTVAVRLLEIPGPAGKSGGRGQRALPPGPDRTRARRREPAEPAPGPKPAPRPKARAPRRPPEARKPAPRPSPTEKNPSRPAPTRAEPQAPRPKTEEPERAVTDVIASPNAPGPAVPETRPEKRRPEPPPPEPEPAPAAHELPKPPPTRSEKAARATAPGPGAVPPDPWALQARAPPPARADSSGPPEEPATTPSEGRAAGQAPGSAVARKQAGGTPGGTGASKGQDAAFAAREGYLRAIRALIERHRRYPRAALRRGQQGTCVVRLEVARSGELERVEVVRSSGFRSLDRAAVETFRKRIRRFPPVPEAIQADPLVIKVPVVFRITRR